MGRHSRTPSPSRPRSPASPGLVARHRPRRSGWRLLTPSIELRALHDRRPPPIRAERLGPLPCSRSCCRSASGDSRPAPMAGHLITAAGPVPTNKSAFRFVIFRSSSRAAPGDRLRRPSATLPRTPVLSRAGASTGDLFSAASIRDDRHGRVGRAVRVEVARGRRRCLEISVFTRFLHAAVQESGRREGNRQSSWARIAQGACIRRDVRRNIV